MHINTNLNSFFSEAEQQQYHRCCGRPQRRINSSNRLYNVVTNKWSFMRTPEPKRAVLIWRKSSGRARFILLAMVIKIIVDTEYRAYIMSEMVKFATLSLNLSLSRSILAIRPKDFNLSGRKIVFNYMHEFNGLIKTSDRIGSDHSRVRVVISSSSKIKGRRAACLFGVSHASRIKDRAKKSGKKRRRTPCHNHFSTF